MRKIFCSISVFAFLCLLSLGYYHSYQTAELRRKAVKAEQMTKEKEEQKEEQKDSTVQESVVSREAVSQEHEYGMFVLKEEDGTVMVYEQDGTTLYEPTGIKTASLPPSMQTEIKNEKYIRSLEELYGFLENYSS